MMYLIEQQIMMSRLPQMKDVLARAYHRAGRLDEAVEEYEKLTTFDPNRPGRDLINPRYYYRLARLYEEKGLTDKAIRRYERFLGFWKNADGDLPERKDAEQRLKRLRRQ
jgi:tetratricopeptide (TPR) repeat protein